MTNKMFLTGLGAVLLSSTTAYADTCTTMPTCSELGYIYSTKLCPTEGKILRCPFNTNALWCPDAIDPQPSTCPTGTYVPSNVPWSATLEACTTQAPTWCLKCQNSGVPYTFSNAISMCPKEDTGFGNQDIFTNVARTQELLGSGTWNLNTQSAILVIGGAYCYQGLSRTTLGSGETFLDFAKGQKMPLVVISPDSPHCPTTNSLFQNKFMGINLQGSANAEANISTKTLGYSAGIMLYLEKGNLRFLTTIDCNNAPIGSSFGNRIEYK